MSVLIKVAAVSLVYICLSAVLKSYRPEFVIFVRIFAISLIFSVIVDDVAVFVTDMLSAFSAFNIESAHVKLLLKVVGIAIVTDFICDTLKDSGENSLAGIVAISAKFLVIYLALPLINGLIIFCLQLI